jgi:hypothetical protein
MANSQDEHYFEKTCAIFHDRSGTMSIIAFDGIELIKQLSR